MIKSRLLSRSTLASTLVGIVPTDPGENRGSDNAEDAVGTACVVVQVSFDNISAARLFSNCALRLPSICLCSRRFPVYAKELYFLLFLSVFVQVHK